MYTLYWCPFTASLAPDLLLADSGLPYEKVLIEVRKGQHREPAYLAINPAGFVPALTLPDGRVMAETAAILLYLCDRHALGLAPGGDEPERATFLQDMAFFSSVIQTTYKRFYFPKRFSTETNTEAGIKARALEMQEEHWGLVERRLAERGGPYMLGARYSAADLYLTMLATWHPDEARLLDRLPAVARCFEAVTERPHVRRLMADYGYSVA